MEMNIQFNLEKHLHLGLLANIVLGLNRKNAAELKFKLGFSDK